MEAACDPCRPTYLKNRFLATQITCLEFIGPYIVAGEGPWMHVYKTSLHEEVLPIVTCRVFLKTNIHGIRLVNNRNDQQETICVFGGRCIRVLLLDFLHGPIRISILTPTITFQDWIWDVQWLPSKEISIILAQNYAILFNPFENQQKAVAHCEEKCILYCAHFVGEDWKNSAILSGTVFKEILIWCPGSNNPSDDIRTDCKILHRLTGHDGVIFSIAYSVDLRKLCSSSDDRSIQIWQHKIAEPILDSEQKRNLTESEWRNSSFILLFKLYGHEARVWKVVMTKEFYVSAGEDSQVCFWKCDDSKKTSKLVKKLACHSGSSIRSLCFNKDNTLLATGGGDGGIKLWRPPSKEKIVQATTNYIDMHQLNDTSEITFLPNDYLREVRLLDNERILAMTNNGILFCYDMETKSISLCISDAGFKSYSVMDIATCKSITICVGNITGDVIFLKTPIKRPVDCQTKFTYMGKQKMFSGKILALKLIPGVILACGPAGKMVSYEIISINGVFSITQCNAFLLPTGKQRWFSTALISKDNRLLICGCRDGSICVYSNEVDRSQCMIKVGLTEEVDQRPLIERHPIQTLPRLHGPNGVTSLYLDNYHIYSTGKDGFLRMSEINYDVVTELNKRWISCCPKWIGGVTKQHDELLVYGFYTDTFRVWNEHDQTILLEIPCGGGHRSWDFQLNSTEATFVFIKNRQIQYSKGDLQANKPICVKPGFHSRQTCHVRHLATLHNRQYCITASEDTTLQILGCLQKNVTYTCTVEHTLKSHISSVKATAICPFRVAKSERNSLMEFTSRNGILMVSVGGRAQMIIWRLKIVEVLPGSIDQPSFQVRELASHMLNPMEKRQPVPWREQKFTVDPETRYMDVVVWDINTTERHSNDALYIIGTACSDSYLRIFCLNTNTRVVNLLLEDPLHQHCILKISHFRTRKDHEIIATAATDGKLIFWDVTPVRDFVLNRENSDFEPKSEKLQPTISVIASIQLHQSSITAMAILEESASSEDQRIILATGGDDTAISVRWLQIKVLESTDQMTYKIKLIERGCASLPDAHSAQITGIHFLSSQYLVTASVDQRICIWSLHTERDFEIKLSFSKISNVADISSITGWQENDDVHSICVAGKGLEIIEANL